MSLPHHRGSYEGDRETAKKKMLDEQKKMMSNTKGKLKITKKKVTKKGKPPYKKKSTF